MTTAVAQGNHTIGYRGAMIEDVGGPEERVLTRCKHRHPTTGEARACVAKRHVREKDVE